MKTPEELDRFVRDAVDDWSIDPPQSLYQGIGSRMRFHNLWRFLGSGGMKLGLFSLSGLTLTGLILFAILGQEQDMEASSSPNPQQASLAGTQFSPPVSHAPGRIYTPDQSFTTTSGPGQTGEPAQHQETLIPGKTAENSTFSNSRTLNFPQDQHNSQSTAENNPVPVHDLSLPISQDQYHSEAGTVREMSYASRLNSLRGRPIPLEFGGAKEHMPALTGFIPEKLSGRLELGLHFNLSTAFFYPESNNRNIEARPSDFSGMSSIGLAYHLPRCFIETGLQWTRFSIKEKGFDLPYNPQVFIDQQWAGQSIDIDTNWTWSYSYLSDSMIHIQDSSLWVSYDTNFVDIYNPVTQTRFDTLKSASWTSSFSMIEIPVLAGYKTFYSGFELRAQGGILLGILSQTGGRVYEKWSAEGLIPVKEHFSGRQFHYSWIVSANLNRYLTDNLSIEGSAHYRSSINGFPSAAGLAPKKFKAWGLGIGIRYRINL